MSKQYQPHELRVVEEKAELDNKIVKLTQFVFNGDSGIFTKLSTGEQTLLSEQLVKMQDYSSILKKRIALF